MSLHGKEKIWFLVNRLQDEREVTDAGQPVALHPANDLNKHYPPMDLVQVAGKLEKEHNAVKLLNVAPTDQTYGKYLFELLPDFDNYIAELRKDPKYLDWIGEKPEPEPTPKAEPILVSSARKNGIMTGKEKIQAVIEDINNKYQGLVTGKVVVLHSGNLEERGLQLHEQTQVLDILANDKRVIKYIAKNEYESRADIYPRDQVDIHEVAMDELHADEMFDQLLAQQLYTVDVLPTFEALADELLGDADLQYQKDVYLLRLLYNRIITVLDAVVSTSVVIEDNDLDFAYVQLTALIDDLLNKPSMKGWQKDAPELYETLLGHAEEIGEGWQYTRATVLKYYARLQKDWMLHHKPDFELDDKLAAKFDELDKLIATHEKTSRQASDNWHKRADTFAKDFRQKLGTDEQVKPSSTDRVSSKEAAEKVDVHSLQPNHYSDRTGKLTVSPNAEVSIAKRGKVKRKNGTKYDQCHLMSCLFKTVNTLKNGITFSTFLGVKYDKNSKKHIRKIRNTIDEINKKVADSTTAKKLIFVHGDKIFIDKSYLKN
jgi:hypothetical protein